MSTQIPNVSPQLESLGTPLLVSAENDVLASIRSRKAKIGVLGMGHVGLPTALGLADLGWQVLGADSSSAIVEQLRGGHLPFYEPGIDKLLTKHIGKNFHPLTELEQAIREATILFVCVGTPQRENGESMRRLRAASCWDFRESRC